MGAGRGVVRLIDAGADEHAVGAKLHHEGGVGGGGDATSGEVHDRQAAQLTRLFERLHRSVEGLRLRRQLFLGE